MKTASTAAPKWGARAGQASGDYLSGAENTPKDQAALAIAAIPIAQQAIQAAFARGAQQKGLQRSGKTGWLNGIKQKGQSNYQTGVSTSEALDKYTTNSGKYDTARNAAASMPRQAKGSAANLARVAAVVNALRAAKVGSTS